MSRVSSEVISPGEVWYDSDGKPIQAHGGGVLFENGVYYWFGENKDGETYGNHRIDVIGVSCYSSQNLIHWKNEGIVLPAVADDPEHDLHPSKVAERPKVIFNKQTGKYVMWLHVDSRDYTAAAAGVAVSDSVTGPYQYLGSMRPNGKDSRDMTVFQDDDGKAYLIHSSDWNSVTIISDLADDYLSFTGHYTRHFDHGQKNTGRESPALFKHNGKYFIITSGTTGWSPNPAEYAVADSVHGPWTVKGNPCKGEGAETTFRSQDTFVLPVQEIPGAFICMGDRWNKYDLRDSRYVWLPLKIEGDELSLEWRDSWSLTEFCQPA
jgi:hypothetical protein